ncbi:hypothetical protein CR513_50429, partial [Mucuna pruriens]
MTYTKLLPLLLEHKLVEIVPLKPLEPPYLRSYDSNIRCGAIGHVTERCWSLKHKVQDLLDDGLFRFQDQGPKVQSNPFPTHKGMAINVVSHENREEAEGASRRKGKIIATRHAVDPISWMEEGSYSSRPNKVTATLIVYIQGNGNPHPKSFIIRYNLAS